MTIEELVKELEEPPGTRKPPSPWEEVAPSLWADWRWQLSHRLNSIEELEAIVDLTPAELEGLSAHKRFRVDITPYFASLIDPHDPNCPIRRQVIPTADEIHSFGAEMIDSLSEDEHSPVPGLVHRYPDRVLMLVTTQCASYCRFCTRSRIVGDPHAQFSSTSHDLQIAYIAANPGIRDVLISGGDPLLLPITLLENLLKRLRAIPHVQIIRIGTRLPVFLPQRVNEELVAMLRRYHPLWMNIHFNHPKEITPEVERALALLADSGIPLGSQTVLLAGINDCPNIIKSLVHKLVMNRVRPYYLYQCDMVHGAGHFRTPVAKGIEIMESLRGHTSGYAIPTFVIDAPEGGGKIPLLPNYMLSMSESSVVVRNYEGFISTYAQPDGYQSHDAANCHYCREHGSKQVQEGVAALLAGTERTIKPEGWNSEHRREESTLPLPREVFQAKKAYNSNGGKRADRRRGARNKNRSLSDLEMVEKRR